MLCPPETRPAARGINAARTDVIEWEAPPWVARNFNEKSLGETCRDDQPFEKAPRIALPQDGGKSREFSNGELSENSVLMMVDTERIARSDYNSVARRESLVIRLGPPGGGPSKQ